MAASLTWRDQPVANERDAAHRIASSRFDALPGEVRAHALRTFINFVGCALGGCRDEAVESAARAFDLNGGGGVSEVLGREGRHSMTDAALLNGMAGAVNAFDDTHAEAVIHPGPPVGAALLALASGSTEAIDGRTFLTAYAWGIELACRLSKAVSVAPAEGDIGWSQTGIAAPVGVAAACGRLMELDDRAMLQAIGIAAVTAAGLRAAHGSMAMHLLPARAAVTGLEAALLAKAGFTGPEQALEGRHGFLALFARHAFADHLWADFGTRFELLANGFKPYPCGIVIHGVIDACLDLSRLKDLTADRVDELLLEVPEVTVALADRPHPTGVFEAQVSAQHWAAAALLRGRAGLAEGSEEAIAAPDIAAVRAKCRMTVRPGLAADAAIATLRYDGGKSRTVGILHCTGSRDNPLDDAALAAKFIDQARVVLGDGEARRLLERCWGLPSLSDVRALRALPIDSTHARTTP